jgi:hypothetical protein
LGELIMAQVRTSPVFACCAALAALALTTADPGVAKAESCPMLTAADVQGATGTHVALVPFNSKPGAGGHCANYASDNGRLYLGVTRLASTAEYTAAVAMVPAQVYPSRAKLPGVGDEALLWKDSSGTLRYMVARKGSHGVVLFPFGKQPTDAQLAKLASIALSR